MWGHGSDEELRESGFTYLARSTADVLDIVG
jgi:hypothetical protein